MPPQKKRYKKVLSSFLFTTKALYFTIIIISPSYTIFGKDDSYFKMPNKNYILIVVFICQFSYVTFVEKLDNFQIKPKI